VADVVGCKSGGGPRENGSDTKDIYPQKVSDLLLISGDREKVSGERRKIRKKASELIKRPGHRQKVSYETRICQRKASELTEIYSEEMRICRETEPLKSTTGKDLGDEVLESLSKNANDEGNYACNTDDCIEIENLGPDDTSRTRSLTQSIHDDNSSIQNDENRSCTLQNNHDAENSKRNHEENNPSICDYETCGTRRRDQLNYDNNPSIQNDENRSHATQYNHDVENNTSSHEENNPSRCDDEHFGSTYDGDILRTAEATTRGSSADIRKGWSEVKSEMSGEKYQDETNDKEEGIANGADLKHTVANDPGCNRGTKELLHEIAREKRERKATKADDADVPEYLWEEHLLNDCPTPWILQERTRLRRAIRLLRARMLKWWKQRVTRSFLE
jgi:hypothetical protein